MVASSALVPHALVTSSVVCEQSTSSDQSKSTVMFAIVTYPTDNLVQICTEVRVLESSQLPH